MITKASVWTQRGAGRTVTETRRGFDMKLQALLSSDSEHRLLGLMLMLLHLALWWDFPGAISRSLMLAHLGIFLIWQPMWSREQRLDWDRLLIFSLVIVAFGVWLNWWLIAFWLVLLIGLVGGRVNIRRADRTAYMIAGLFLVFELLIGVVPPMFAVSAFSPELARPLGYALLAFPCSLLFIRGQAAAGQPSRAVDFLYGLTVALLVIILVLGSLLSMYHFGYEYAVALLQAVLGIAVFLLAISWLWTPVAGFSGLGQIWTRYLLNVGTPFEEWLGHISSLAARSRSPEDFLRGAIESLTVLPWLPGCEWKSSASTGTAGRITPYALNIRIRDLDLTLYTERPVAASLQLHGQLLVQLVSDFYQAKHREQELAQKAQLQAIYETGARVTHDIKNLLQSLYVVAVAVQADQDDRGPELQALLKRQLPNITHRLQLALDKLQAPQEEPTSYSLLSQWWAEAHESADDVKFSSEIRHDGEIPRELFSRVLENLLDNARFKRQSAPDIAVHARVAGLPDGVRLEVEDTGVCVPDSVSESLFRGPVSSNSGLGVGLYQSYQQARELGFELRLDHNEDGRVVFALEGRWHRQPTMQNVTPLRTMDPTPS